MRSIPEKTLEHWTSIYLTDRFPNGALWWPTSGEDVLAELPRLAATGPGKTLALELKTTEVVGTEHVLWIDTRQLDRYLYPPFGPPLPVYYVFPVPHWTGPLRSRHGRTPGPTGGMVEAPPQWWRQRAGWSWFGEWLYVMSAQSLSAALPPDWRSQKQRRAKLFTVNTSRGYGGIPAWTTLFARTPGVVPLQWKPFWNVVTRCGPHDGVRWLTVLDGRDRPYRVRVIHRDEERAWHLGELLDQPWWERAVLAEAGGSERTLLHIPDSALATSSITATV